MSKSYELTYIIRPNLEKESKDSLVKRFDDILTKNGAKINDSSDWDTRHLAYEINNNKTGLYHIVTFTTDNNKPLNEFNRLSKINNDILRHIVVSVSFEELKSSHEKQAAAEQRIAEHHAQREAERKAAQSTQNQSVNDSNNKSDTNNNK